MKTVFMGMAVLLVLMSFPVGAAQKKVSPQKAETRGDDGQASATYRLINPDAIPADIQTAKEARAETDAKTKELIDECLRDEKFVTAYKSVTAAIQEKIRDITATGYYDVLVVNGINDFSKRLGSMVDGIKGKGSKLKLEIMREMLFKTLKSKGYKVTAGESGFLGLGDFSISW